MLLSSHAQKCAGQDRPKPSGRPGQYLSFFPATSRTTDRDGTPPWRLRLRCSLRQRQDRHRAVADRHRMPFRHYIYRRSTAVIRKTLIVSTRPYYESGRLSSALSQDALVRSGRTIPSNQLVLPCFWRDRIPKLDNPQPCRSNARNRTNLKAEYLFT